MAEHESYGIVLQRILRDSSLSAEAKAIYAYLCTFAGSDGTCYPSVSIMCKELDISENRFYRHMKHLRDRGIVTVEKTRSKCRFAQNVYTVPRLFPYRQNESIQSEGTGNVNIISQPLRNEGTGNEGVNNTSLTNTRGLTNTRNNGIEQSFIEQICRLLNSGKQKASSKGRVKPETGKWTLAELVKDGISQEEITAAAMEIAQKGIDHDWFSFARLFKKKR